MWRTVSAKTTPIKVDDLNRGAYGRDGRATETSNTPYDPAKRLEIFRRTPPTIPSFPLRSLIESNDDDDDDDNEQFHSSRISLFLKVIDTHERIYKYMIPLWYSLSFLWCPTKESKSGSPMDVRGNYCETRSIMLSESLSS